MPGSIIIAIVSTIAAALAPTAPVWLGPLVGALAGAATAYLLGKTLYKADDQVAAAFGNQLQDRVVTAKDPISPRRVIYGQVRVGGVITFMEASTDKRYLHFIITFTGHEIEEFTTIYINEDTATLDGSGFVTSVTGPDGTAYDDVDQPKKYNSSDEAGSIRIKTDLGTTGSQPFSDAVAETTGWTTNYRQEGCAKFYVRLEYFADDFPNGIPNITALIKGKKVYDPRTATTVYSANSALCVNDYLTDSVNGLGATYADEIDETALTAAANECDENVTLDAGGTEKRYECHGMFAVESAPEIILPQLLSSMAGRVCFVNGLWVIYAGAYVTPSQTLTETDLSGPITVRARLAKRDLFNSVRGQFADPAKLYQPSDYPPLSSSTYVTEDQGEELWGQIDLPFTTSYTMCQRIARIELRRVRQQIRIELTTKMTAYPLQPGDTFYLTLTKYGWSAKVFEVTEMNFAIGDDGALGLQISAAETDSTIYDWDATDEQAMAASPDTNLPNPWTVAVPGAPVISETLYSTILSSGQKTLARATWAKPNDYFAQSGLSRYQFEYKETTASSWTIIPDLTQPETTIFDLEPTSYQFRVKAFNVYGAQSAYSSTTQQNIVGLTAAPANVSSFSVHPTGGMAQMTWLLHPDLDVRVGGKIEVRHTVSASNYTWSDSNLIDSLDGLATQAFTSQRPGTYMVKARDSSNVYSTSAAVFYASEAHLTGFTTVASIDEHTTFTGTRENLSLSGGTLDITDPTSYEARYYFPASTTANPTYVDLGSVAARRFESVMDMIRFDDGDLIDSRSEVDTWSSVDGTNVEIGEVYMYARTTNDDPSSSPTWGNWFAFRVAELNCRAAQFKLEYVNEADTYNMGVTELSINVKVNSAS